VQVHRSRPSSAAARPPKHIIFALRNRARSTAKLATNTLSRFAASIIANCTATTMRPLGGPGQRRAVAHRARAMAALAVGLLARRFRVRTDFRPPARPG
jgi:hypothetical protein